jgi:hypothetical protein
LTTDVRPVGHGQCDIIDMIARPYWISLFAQKAL